MEKLRAILKEMKEWLEMRELVNTLEVIEYVNRIVGMVDDMDYRAREKQMGDISKLREEYFLLNGKKPFSGWTVSVLEIKIAELKEEQKLTDKALRTKKAGWEKK